MELLARIAQVIVPVFPIVGIGYVYGRWRRPEMGGFNRIVLDMLSPVIHFSLARASPTPMRAPATCCSAR